MSCSLYFSHQREVFERDGMLLAVTDFITMLPEEKSESKTVRFRTIGDATCTGAVESTASTVNDIIDEVAARIGERGGRADDKRSESAMEDRKKEGYF